MKSAMALFSTVGTDGEGAAEALIGTGIVAAMPGGVHIKGVPAGPVGAQAPPYGLYSRGGTRHRKQIWIRYLVLVGKAHPSHSRDLW